MSERENSRIIVEYAVKKKGNAGGGNGFYRKNLTLMPLHNRTA